jgi:hypothetical protein
MSQNSIVYKSGPLVLSKNLLGLRLIKTRLDEPKPGTLVKSTIQFLERPIQPQFYVKSCYSLYIEVVYEHGWGEFEIKITVTSGQVGSTLSFLLL